MLLPRGAVGKLSLVVMLVAVARAQAPSVDTVEPDIYLIKATDCVNGKEWQETGFRVDKVPGIITALHGVASCNKFEADQGDRSFQDLRLVSIDPDDDLAVITSSEIGPAVVLKESAATAWPKDYPVTAFGHPEGATLLPRPLTVSMTLSLDKLLYLDKQVKNDLGGRGSPALKTVVIQTLGALIAGDSGAPVLDSAGYVIGVVNGGLKGGLSGITWFMPLRQKRFRPKDDNDPVFSRLRYLDPSGVFTSSGQLSPTLPIEVSQFDGDNELGQGHHMYTKVTLSANGKLSGETRLENWALVGRFCGSVDVWFLDGQRNILGSAIEVGSWCTGYRIMDNIVRKSFTNVTVQPGTVDVVRKIVIEHGTGARPGRLDQLTRILDKAQGALLLPTK
jgi:hypothetical protein